MSFLAKFEQMCATFIERTFAKSFPSDLEPAQIARKLVSTMEAQTHSEEGRLQAPRFYAVSVNPDDFDRLAEHREFLERSWAQLLQELAAGVGIVFDGGETRVTLAPNESVPLGAIAIDAAHEAQPDIRFSLRMIKGVPPNGVYPIEGRTSIGRSDDSTIVLVDPSVSRAHAIIEIVDRRARVADLGSTNGTFVNGRRVSAAALSDGDELRFGNTKMQLQSP